MITTMYGCEVELLSVTHRSAENEAITYRRIEDLAIRQCQAWQLRATAGAAEVEAALDLLAPETK